MKKLLFIGALVLLPGTALATKYCPPSPTPSPSIQPTVEPSPDTKGDGPTGIPEVDRINSPSFNNGVGVGGASS